MAVYKRTVLICVAALVAIAHPASAQPAVAGGSGFSLILKTDGTVWSSGSNQWGQLGNDTRTDSQLPVQVIGLTNVTAIAAGGTHAMALTSGGRVFVWGGMPWGSSATSWLV